MANGAISYFKKLNKILLDTKVTDKKNKEISISDGVNKAVNLISSQSKKGNKLVFVGNGGSASIASHMTVDFWKNGGMKAICFNDGAQITCLGNDYGYQYVFEKPIRMFAGKGDILIAISSSGRSDNILRAVSAAKDTKCRIITMSGFGADNNLRYSGGDLNFYVSSSSYGFVEIIHQALCHCILDLITEKNKEFNGG